jgi:4-amino-4-deoxy-L-arabinose transferase-like glycosyltransferase
MAKRTSSKPTPRKIKKVKQAVDTGQWLDRTGTFLAKHSWKAMSILFALSLVISGIYYQQSQDSPITSFYKWDNSDMSFFDLWAKHIAEGDWLCDTVLHPFHDWHDDLAEEYFNQFPEERAKYVSGPDSVSIDRGQRALINDIYSGKVYHQEPLYTYLMAITYAIFGYQHSGIFFWQFLLTALTAVLIFLIGKRTFNAIAGLAASLLFIFCGSVRFFEMVLLRTTLVNFLTVLLLFLFLRVLEKTDVKRSVMFGVASGVALLCQSYFILFVAAAFIWLMLKERKQWRAAFPGMAAFMGSVLIVMSLLFIRNIVAGVPVTAIASHGTITYVPNNVQEAYPFESFFIHMPTLAYVMHESEGKLLKAMGECVKTFDSFGNFIKLYRQKISGMFMWYELPNNVNFYLFREIAPVLKVLPVSYAFIAPLGLAGMIFGLWRRRPEVWPVLLMTVICMAPIMLTGVMARYRSPLVVMMIILAAYMLVEIFTLLFRRQFKYAFAGIGLSILAFIYTANTVDDRFVFLGSDIDTFYRYHYLPQLMEKERAGDLPGFLAVTTEMVEDIPDYFLEVPRRQPIVRGNEAETSRQIATCLESHYNALKVSGKEQEAAFFQDRINILRTRADDFYRRLGTDPNG